MLSILLFASAFIYAPKMLHAKCSFIRSNIPYLISNSSNLIRSLEPPSGGELKLLTHLSAEQWSHNWILYIANSEVQYSDHYYLDYKKRIFNTKCIIENPYYMDGDSELTNFKKHIIDLTESAYVFFKYTDLNTPGQVRYYLEWKLH